MSYCRWSDQSDFYAWEDISGYWRLEVTDGQSLDFDSPGEMADCMAAWADVPFPIVTKRHPEGSLYRLPAHVVPMLREEQDELDAMEET